MKKTAFLCLFLVAFATFSAAQNLSSIDNVSASTRKTKTNRVSKHKIAALSKDMYLANVNTCFSMLPLPNSRQYTMRFHQPFRAVTQVMILDNDENVVATEMLFAGTTEMSLNFNGFEKGKYEVKIMTDEEQTYAFLVP